MTVPAERGNVNFYNPLHPHERDEFGATPIPKVFDGEGRCLVCGLMVDRDDARDLLVLAREAFRISREYVGEDTLPAIPGWTWYEIDCAIADLLGHPRVPRTVRPAPEPVVVKRRWWRW